MQNPEHKEKFREVRRLETHSIFSKPNKYTKDMIYFREELELGRIRVIYNSKGREVNRLLIITDQGLDLIDKG